MSRRDDKLIQEIEQAKLWVPGYCCQYDEKGEQWVLLSGETKAVDATAMTATGNITVKEIDRDGDVVEPRGVDLRAFRKNPIVFFNHMPMLPIGTSTKQDRFDDRIEAVTKFHDLTAEAEEIAELVMDKVLRGLSIGFMVHERGAMPEEFLPKKEPKDGEIARQGTYFKKVELLEYSHVSVPSVRGALTTRVERGKVKSPVMEYLFRKLIDQYGVDEKAPPWAPGIDLLTQTEVPVENAELCLTGDYVVKALTGTVGAGWVEATPGDVLDLDEIDSVQSEEIVAIDESPIELDDIHAAECECEDCQVDDEIRKEMRGVVPFAKTPTAPRGTSWDAGAAKKRLRDWSSAGGAFDLDISGQRGKYRRGFAFVVGDGTRQGDYSLPHHDIIDDRLVVVWRGVAAAMGAILGARGGMNLSTGDRREAHGHIKQHYPQFDAEAPEFRDYECDEFVELHVAGRVEIEPECEYMLADGLHKFDLHASGVITATKLEKREITTDPAIEELISLRAQLQCAQEDIATVLGYKIPEEGDSQELPVLPLLLDQLVNECHVYRDDKLIWSKGAISLRHARDLLGDLLEAIEVDTIETGEEFDTALEQAVVRRDIPKTTFDEKAIDRLSSKIDELSAHQRSLRQELQEARGKVD